MHRLTAYRLRIDSELPLPELLRRPADGAACPDQPDVRIEQGVVDESVWSDADRLGPALWIKPGHFYLRVEGVARFHVSCGQRIVVQPHPGVDGSSLRLFLLGSALGALLQQRGLLVLHGNAIVVDGGCLVCVGHSGAGKSTTATGFMLRGHPILADDVVPVSAQGLAIPGIARVKLWQDVADRFGIDTSALERLRPGMDKFNYPIHHALPAAPVPLKWLFVLEPCDDDAIRIEPLHGAQAFGQLCAHSYRYEYLKPLGLLADHLRLCGQFMPRVQVCRVHRPRHRFALDELLDALVAHARGMTALTAR